MSKYAPLTDFLAAQDLQEVAMSFADIERVIGTRLPPSKQYPAWWSNNPSNNVMTRAWLAAGFRTERVDVASERLVFRRTSVVPPQVGAGRLETSPVGFFDRVRAALGGTVRIAPGVDVTEPLEAEWGAMR